MWKLEWQVALLLSGIHEYKRVCVQCLTAASPPSYEIQTDGSNYSNDRVTSRCIYNHVPSAMCSQDEEKQQQKTLVYSIKINVFHQFFLHRKKNMN